MDETLSSHSSSLLEPAWNHGGNQFASCRYRTSACPLNMEIGVAWDIGHCLWSYIIEINGKEEVINLTRFVMGDIVRSIYWSNILSSRKDLDTFASCIEII